MPDNEPDEAPLTLSAQFPLYVLDGREVVETKNWAKWCYTQNHTDWRVALFNHSKRVVLSTVFLGMDLNGGKGERALFESIVFVNGKPDAVFRFPDFDTAEDFHNDYIQSLHQHEPPK